MARPARGAEVLDMAQEMILHAQTIDELRQAQAVVLPLAYGLSLEQTARAIGQSVGWTCRLRNRFLPVTEASWWCRRSRPNWRLPLAVAWLCPRYTTCSIGMAGESSPLTSVTPRAIRSHKKPGKKTPQNNCRNPRQRAAGVSGQADVSGRSTLWAH